MEVPAIGVCALSKDILLDQLDSRYFAYAAALESPLNTLALDRSLFFGKVVAGQITSLRELPELATCLPWLFVQMFPSVSEADFLNIAEAGTLLNLSFVLRDHYVDGQLSQHKNHFFLQQQLYTLALRKFHSIFQAHSVFWTYFDRYVSQHTAALLEEIRNHHGQVTNYSLKTLQKLGSGKALVVMVAPTALALKAGDEASIGALETATGALTAALQLADDITDWADDYRHHRYTLPLTEAIPVEHWPTPTLSLGEIGQRIEQSVIIETLLKQVLAWCQQARDAVADLPCPRWVAFVESYEASIQSYQRAFVAKKVLRILTQEAIAGQG